MKVLKRRYLNKAERQKIRDRLFQLQEEFHIYATYNISKREANRIVFTYKYKICGSGMAVFKIKNFTNR